MDMRSLVAAVASVCMVGLVVAITRQPVAAAPPRSAAGKDGPRPAAQRRSSSNGSQVVELGWHDDLLPRGRSPPVPSPGAMCPALVLGGFDQPTESGPSCDLFPGLSWTRSCSGPALEKEVCRFPPGTLVRSHSDTELLEFEASPARSFQAADAGGDAASVPLTPGTPSEPSNRRASSLKARSGSTSNDRGASIEAALLAACLPPDGSGAFCREATAIAMRWRSWRGSGDEIFGVGDASLRRRENLSWRLWWQACRAQSADTACKVLPQAALA